MTDEARQARNQYQREYRKKNRHKIREIEERYWEKKAAELKKLQEGETNG